MIKKKGWDEFRNTGLLLLINQFLHVFGWAIVFEFDENDDVASVYPARCKFRGFSNEIVDQAYKDVTKYMKENIFELEEEVNA